MNLFDGHCSIPPTAKAVGFLSQKIVKEHKNDGSC